MTEFFRFFITSEISDRVTIVSFDGRNVLRKKVNILCSITFHRGRLIYYNENLYLLFFFFFFVNLEIPKISDETTTMKNLNNEKV